MHPAPEKSDMCIMGPSDVQETHRITTHSHSANGPCNKKFELCFPTNYEIPNKSLKVGHWLSEHYCWFSMFCFRIFVPHLPASSEPDNTIFSPQVNNTTKLGEFAASGICKPH